MILTIAIPTYNRRDRLIKQIKSLQGQKRFDEVHLLIIDNHSDYDIKGAIINEFGQSFFDRLTLVVNNRNYGLSANLCNLFLYCKSEWMWTLGDDDETLEDSISIVLDNIHKYEDVGMFKYSIENFQPHQNQDIDNLHDFIHYFADGRHGTGDLIFLSNNVYNMPKTMKYFGNTLSDCYCVIPQLLPVFNGLDKKDFTVKFCSVPIVRYLPPDAATAWNYINIALNLSIIPYFNYSISAAEYICLGDIMSRNFRHKAIAYKCLSYDDKKRGLYLYDRLYYSYYYFNGTYKDKILKKVVHFLTLFNIKLSTIRRIKRIFRIK